MVSIKLIVASVVVGSSALFFFEIAAERRHWLDGRNVRKTKSFLRYFKSLLFETRLISTWFFFERVAERLIIYYFLQVVWPTFVFPCEFIVVTWIVKYNFFAFYKINNTSYYIAISARETTRAMPT